MNVKNRTIFCNDNLYILRGLDTESVDLIYLDPPLSIPIAPILLRLAVRQQGQLSRTLGRYQT